MLPLSPFQVEAKPVPNDTEKNGGNPPKGKEEEIGVSNTVLLFLGETETESHNTALDYYCIVIRCLAVAPEGTLQPNRNLITKYNRGFFHLPAMLFPFSTASRKGSSVFRWGASLAWISLEAGLFAVAWGSQR